MFSMFWQQIKILKNPFSFLTTCMPIEGMLFKSIIRTSCHVVNFLIYTKIYNMTKRWGYKMKKMPVGSVEFHFTTLLIFLSFFFLSFFFLHLILFFLNYMIQFCEKRKLYYGYSRFEYFDSHDGNEKSFGGIQPSVFVL